MVFVYIQSSSVARSCIQTSLEITMAGDNFESKQQFEVSGIDVNDLPEFSFLVRPCEWYKDEYRECKSVKGRFHQYFIFGEKLDCSQWKSDFDDCIKFRKSKDLGSLENIIRSEMHRKQKRSEAATANDVWEYRDSPPDNWNIGLPEWQIQHKKGSHLDMVQEMAAQGKDMPVPMTSVKCTIL